MYRLYALFDNKANTTFGPVMTCRTQAEALRYFGDITADPQSLPGKHTGDFDLIELATYDENSGIIVGHQKGPETIITGKTILDLRTRAVDDPNMRIA
nr:MAG TPA: DNA binding protein [Microviridae sp.]